MNKHTRGLQTIQEEVSNLGRKFGFVLYQIYGIHTYIHVICGTSVCGSYIQERDNIQVTSPVV